MAIKPEDCLKLTEQEEKMISVFEKNADAQLREQFTTSQTTVKILLGCQINERVFNKINLMYMVTGWKIVQTTEVSQGKQNYYLEFSKRANDTSYDVRDQGCVAPWNER